MQIISIKKITAASPLLFLISSSLLIAITVVRFLILPLSIRMSEDRKKHDYYTAKISSEADYAGLRQNIRQKIDIMDKILEDSSSVSLSSDISSYLEHLISIGRQFGISFTRMQPQEPVIDRQITLYPLLLVFPTSYHNLGRFVSALEKQPNLYRVDRLAIDAGEHGSCDIKLLLSCRIPGEAGND